MTEKQLVSFFKNESVCPDSGHGYLRPPVCPPVWFVGLPEAEPEVENDAGTLEALAKKIIDSNIRDYIEETIKCLRINALRASVVFLWSGAIRTLQHKLLNKPNKDLNAALQKHDPKARKVSRIDHFSYIKDKVALLAAADLGLLDKSEKDTLEEALNLKNRCGHPANYKPGVKKVSSYIEDIISILF